MTSATYATENPNRFIIDDQRGVATIICTDATGSETGRALISTEDIEAVRRHRWHCWRTITKGSKRRGRGRRYVATRIDGKRVSLHRFILGDPPAPGVVPDHISGNGLDNRRANLRWATPSENACNAHHRVGASGYVGVYWDHSKKRWAAEVQAGGRRVHRSRHLDKREAARVRDAAAIRYQGQFARLNFEGGSSGGH